MTSRSSRTLLERARRAWHSWRQRKSQPPTLVGLRRTFWRRLFLTASLALLLAVWARAPTFTAIPDAVAKIVAITEWLLGPLGIPTTFLTWFLAKLNVGYAIVFGPFLVLGLLWSLWLTSEDLQLKYQEDGATGSPLESSTRRTQRGILTRLAAALLLVATNVSQVILWIRFFDLREYVPPAARSSRMWNYPWTDAGSMASWFWPFRSKAWSGFHSALPSGLEGAVVWSALGDVISTPFQDFPWIYPAWWIWLAVAAIAVSVYNNWLAWERVAMAAPLRRRRRQRG